jgi:outer membrane protein assembly factor BamD
MSMLRSLAFLRPLALALCFIGLIACSEADEKPYVEQPVEELYNDAMNALQQKDYGEAARLFDEVERQHPYSNWASKAQLMAAFSHYQSYKYDDAINTLDRFIQIHPGHPDISYAYYLKALCYYEQISDVRRDQLDTKKAMEALQDVTRRFPTTPYARDAELKLALARDHLAGKEMEIGRYYLSQKQYIASLGRFRKVIEDYQTTSHVPEALHRLVEANLALGIPKEAKIAAAVLGHNFPGSKWYQDSYALLTKQNLKPEDDGSSWLSHAFK